MSKLSNILKLSPLALALSVAAGASVVSTTASAGASGNLGVFSQYVLRGITNSPEDDSVALQGGFDYAADSGLYAGYWGSSLGYTSKSGDGFENDLYAGYAGEMGMMSYDIGAIYYYYINIDDSDAFELAGSVGYGPVTLGAKYLTKDVAWGNKGDVYWTLGYSADLPKDFSFGATLGYYTYEDSGKFIATSAEDSAFRHLDLSLSHPIGTTGADMSVTYIVGGEDRQGTDQDDTVVFGLGYGFDI